MGTMRQSRAPRVARGLVAASVATFVALLSHVAGGGAMPGWLGIVVPWVLSVFVCTLLAGRRLSVFRLSLSVTLSQVLFHGLFVLGAADAGAVTAGGHHHGAITLAPLSGETTAALYADAAMWGWHVLAAVVTVAALHRGERVLAALRTLAGELVAWWRRRQPVAVLSPVPDAPRAPLFVAALSVDDAPRLAPLRRRGPPALRVL